MNKFLPPITCAFVGLVAILVRVIVRLRGPHTPRRHLLPPATGRVLASSDTICLPLDRNTAHLLARQTTGTDRLPVANTTADSFSVRLIARQTRAGKRGLFIALRATPGRPANFANAWSRSPERGAVAPVAYRA